MTRSAMIEIMWDYVSNIESDYDIYLKYTDITGLLSKLEEAGMSPPVQHPVRPYTYEAIEAIERAYRQWDPEIE